VRPVVLGVPDWECRNGTALMRYPAGKTGRRRGLYTAAQLFSVVLQQDSYLRSGLGMRSWNERSPRLQECCGRGANQRVYSWEHRVMESL
jgi:hypothetical protein